MQNVESKQPVYSFTIKELLDARDGNFIHHDEYTSELKPPIFLYAYANTIVFEVYSSKYGKEEKVKGGKTGINKTKYKIFILFEDFYTIGKDQEISLEDAIDYAINFGDIHCRCNCPAAQFWGYNYISTQMKYLYGIPREKRFPVIRNPQLKGTICKHLDIVLNWILNNKELMAKAFRTYYGRLKDGQSLYAVNANGNTITIGHKNDEGDVFFERQEEEREMEEMKNAVPEDNDEIGDPNDWFDEDEEIVED